MIQEPGLGRILLWPSPRLPNGWWYCNGGLLSTFEHERLFSLMGNTFGGDGSTTFALPDLRGRRAVGATPSAPLGTHVSDAAAGSDSPGFLGLDYIIRLDSPYTGHTDLLGEVAWSPFADEVAGWLPADGRLVRQSPEHFQLERQLGTTYGGGRGQFALPDLRQRAAVGAKGTLKLGATGSAAVGTAGKPQLGALSLQPILQERSWGAGDKLVGSIVAWAGNGPPPGGWMECLGQELPVAQNAALHAVVGQAFGGDGRSTFALPDLGARFPVGAATGGPKVGSAGGLADGSGQAPYLALRYLIATSGIFV
jgi:microcystin-dependent protein